MYKPMKMIPSGCLTTYLHQSDVSTSASTATLTMDEERIIEVRQCVGRFWRVYTVIYWKNRIFDTHVLFIAILSTSPIRG